MQGRSSSAVVKTELHGVYKHLMTGVSHMLPLVVAGRVVYRTLFCLRYPGLQRAGHAGGALFQIGGKATLRADGAGTGWVLLPSQYRSSGSGRAYWRMLASLCGAGFHGRIVAGFLAVTAYGFWRKILKLPASMEARLSLCWFCRYCLHAGYRPYHDLRGGWPRFCGDGRADDVLGI